MYTPPPIPSRNVYPNVNGAVSKFHLHNLEYQNGLNLHVLTPPPLNFWKLNFLHRIDESCHPAKLLIHKQAN